MINWDMIENLLMRSRPNFIGQFRVAIYSRMPYSDGQEATAENHIKFMKLILDCILRRSTAGGALNQRPVFQRDFGVNGKG